MEEEEQVDLEEIVAEVQAQLQAVAQAPEPGMSQLAAMQEKRVARLQRAEGRLSARLGADHPKVAALRRKGTRAETLGRRAAATAAFTGRLPEVKPYESLVYGRVTSQAGAPVAGVRVRVYDKDRKYDDVLGYTETDADGHFFLVYHQRAFQEPGEKAPELYLQVETKRGRVLLSTEDRLRREAGQYEYFELVLDTT